MRLQKFFCPIKEYERRPICFLKDFQIALAICNASQLWSTTSHAYTYLLCYVYRYYLTDGIFETGPYGVPSKSQKPNCFRSR